jgi:hypothetical protein
MTKSKAKARNGRVAVLEKQIKWIEAHSHHGNNNNDTAATINSSTKQLKGELAELLEEEAEADKLRSFLCIAAELLVSSLYVQSAMIGLWASTKALTLSIAYIDKTNITTIYGE